MLYLNSVNSGYSHSIFKDLTLTSVVFELANAVFFKPVIADLTLTSVVFEYFSNLSFNVGYCI